MSLPSPRVSVVIPTRNRRRLLPALLAALASQTADTGEFEVIIVDNASTDGTAELLSAAAASANNLTCIREEAVGSSAARNAGCALARADWIAFIDDDCLPTEGWMTALLRCLDQHPEIGAMVGRYEPPPDFIGPRWLHPAVISFDRGPVPRLVNKLQGGNMAVRRSALDRVGGFRTDLGLHGEHRGWGEETALSKAIRDQGWPILYWPESLVYHLVKPEKESARPLLIGAFRRGLQDGAIEGRQLPVRVALLRVVRALFGPRRDAGSHWQARAFLRVYDATRWAGTAVEGARSKMRVHRP